MNHSNILGIVLGISLLLGNFCVASVAAAATKSVNLTISANVIATCSITSPSPSFGHPEAGVRDWAGNLAANCSNGATYTLAFDSEKTAAGEDDTPGVTANVTLTY